MTTNNFNNSNPKVSVLVPIYNVSDYIERCALSLFNQTFSDIEYIFVNDATTDNSIELLQKVLMQFPERIKQVKIIHHETNQGLAVTRNTAINASNGDYVAVVDSDDFVEHTMIEQLLQKAVAEDADIVVSDVILEYADKSVLFCDKVFDGRNERIHHILMSNAVSHNLWNKLLRRSLYIREDCRVPKGLNYFEDNHVLVRLFYFANKITKIDQAFYHYTVGNPTSVSRNKVRMHFENVLTFWKLLDEFLKEHNQFEQHKHTLELAKVKNKVRLMIDTHSSQLRKEFANMFREEEKKYINHFKRGEKLMLLLIRYRQFWLAQLFHNLLLIKHKKPIHSFF
jgi:glycosyltransferase involved in cell wall biosynthesis